jgi:hypothetical protein
MMVHEWEIELKTTNAAGLAIDTGNHFWVDER